MVKSGKWFSESWAANAPDTLPMLFLIHAPPAEVSRVPSPETNIAFWITSEDPPRVSPIVFEVIVSSRAVEPEPDGVPWKTR